jgi:hypothetical protein
MRTWFLLLAFIALSANTFSQSCCATSNGNNWSILPNLNKHVLGARYTFRQFHSIYPKSFNPELSGRVTSENIQTLEVFGRFNVSKHLQLSVFLPFSTIQQSSPTKNNRVTGLGDIVFMLQYQVLNPNRCHVGNSRHQLRVGFGTKLPSGEFMMNEDRMFATSLQLGTGSVDFIQNVIYTYRYKQFGMNASLAYRANTVNPAGYRFGDRAQLSTNFFYVLDVKAVQLMPQVGLNYDYAFFNVRKGKALTYTGGHFVNCTVGMDVYFKRVAISTAFTPAIMNKLNWSGENRHRFNAELGVFYNF